MGHGASIAEGDESKEPNTNEIVYEKNDKNRQRSVLPNARRVLFVGEGMDAIANTQRETVEVQKSDATKEMIKKALLQHFLFSSVPEDDLNSIIMVMTERKMEKDEVIITQGESGAKADKFYVVQTGKVGVITNGSAIGEPIGPQGSFGELALMYNCPRAATITCISAGHLWCLDRVNFKHFLITAKQQEASRGQTIFKDAFDRIGLQDVPAATLDAVMQALTRQVFESGQKIITQGETGHNFYIVEAGKLNVTRTNEGKTENVATLEKGAFFGEQALLSGDKRNATITAASKVMCLILAREDFEELFGKADKLKERLAKAAAGRSMSVKKRTLPDVRLSQLRPVTVLGKGAFGVVELVFWEDNRYALKMLQKKQLVATKQTENVLREKMLMHEMTHPYILKLVATMADKNCLYLLLEFLQGGDLFSKLCEFDGYFEVADAVYYAATVCSGLGYMHSLGMVYRDLKPENLVLDKDGVCKIVDFGMAKKVEQRTFTVCGTPEYMAPEIINSQGHNKGADYWALGILAYEISYGTSPFADPAQNHMRIYKAINKCKVAFPAVRDKNKHASLQDLVRNLLKRRPMKRYGMRVTGVQEIKDHRYFKESEMFKKLAKKSGDGDSGWILADQGQMEPPHKPNLKLNGSQTDCTAFGEWGGVDPPLSYTAGQQAFEDKWIVEFGPIQNESIPRSHTR